MANLVGIAWRKNWCMCTGVTEPSKGYDHVRGSHRLPYVCKSRFQAIYDSWNRVTLGKRSTQMNHHLCWGYGVIKCWQSSWCQLRVPTTWFVQRKKKGIGLLLTIFIALDISKVPFLGHDIFVSSGWVCLINVRLNRKNRAPTGPLTLNHHLCDIGWGSYIKKS